VTSGECPSLEAVTRGLVKPQQTYKTKCVNCRMSGIVLVLFVVMSCKWPIDKITNPNDVYNHSNTLQSISFENYVRSRVKERYNIA
jgi:hypothetical protein